MKDVLLQKKNLNIVVERYKYNNINKIKAATATAIGITIFIATMAAYRQRSNFIPQAVEEPA